MTSETLVNGKKKSRSHHKSIGPGGDEELGVKEKRITKITSKALHKFDRKGISRFAKLASGIASNVLSAYLGFKDPRKRRREYLIPKDKAAWLEWLVYVAKKRINVEYLTDKELRKVIIRARPNLSPHKKSHVAIEDPDLPPCIEWNEKQVGDWITSIGWPQLRETFVRNVITGRRLVLIDCTALNKMGMTDLASMREVAGKIRELLGTPPPNALRPIVRIPPFERFLRRKVYNGRNYDEMTFEKFCDSEGFNYELIADNKNAQIPCTCEVLITTPEQAEADEDGEGDEDDEEHSLKNAPTVEYLVRNAIVRNKTVDQILSDILENVFLPPRERKYGKEVWGTLKRGIGEGYDDLHLYYPKDRLDFASGVAHHLIDELYKTVGILNDISQLEKNIKDDITSEDMTIFQDAAMILMEEAAPIASLLALGELDLESIFRKEPTFEKYVDGVIQDAEKKTNELVPDASAFVDDVISEAWRKIPDMDLKGLNPDLRHSILRMANQILFGITEDKNDIVDSIVGSGGKRGEMGSPASPKVGGKTPPPPPPPPKDGKTKQQQLAKRRQSQSQPHGTAKPSARSSHTQETLEKNATPAGEAPAETSTENQSSAPPETEPASGHRASEARKTVLIDGKPPGTGESGSASDNKDGESPKQGKGKGKKHHGDKEKDKHKKEDQPPSAGGEGEGDVANAVTSDAQQNVRPSQSFTVHTATLELDLPKAKRPTTADHHPSTPHSARLSTAERRDSPLLRSPMTLTTPTEHGRDSPIPRSPMSIGTAGRLVSAAARAASFVSSEGEYQTLKKPTTAIVNAAVLPQKGPALGGPTRPTPPTNPKKVLRMSRDLDRQIKPLLEPSTPTEPKKPSVDIPNQVPPEGMMNPRQGKAIPPSQQMYNQQQQILQQQQQRLMNTKPGEQLKPAAYHQRRGVLAKGEKDSTRKFGSIFEPEDAPPHDKVADQPKEAEKKTNFVLIPKALKQGQQRLQGLPPLIPNPKLVPGSDSGSSSRKTVPENKPQVRAATTDMQKSTTKEAEQKTPEQEKRRSASVISETAQQIWDQMKEQYDESRKGDLQEENKPSTSKDVTDGQKISVEDNEGEQKRNSGHSFQKPNKRQLVMTAPSELIIDHQHVLEMKEHRDIMVEDWAKRHTMMDPLDPNLDKDERTRLVRMTADKVVTEICTMALTHLLLEAEAGKNTEKIMDTLRRLQKDAKESAPQDIMLWEAHVEKPVYGQYKQNQARQSYQSDRSSGKSSGRSELRKIEQNQNARLSELPTPEQKPQLRSILHIGTATGQTTAAASAPTEKLKSQAKSVVVNAVKGAYEDSDTNKPLTRSTPTSIRKDQYVTRL